MTFKLIATITHKSFGDPVIKEMFYQGDTFDDILDKISNDANPPPNFMHNLKHHKRMAFKDARGVKHSWRLELMEHLN